MFTLASLLFAADEGGIPARHCFFFSLCAFCHRADLFRSFSPSFLIKRAFSAPGRAFPRTSTRRPPLSSSVLVLLLDPRKNQTSSVHTQAKGLLCSTEIPAAVLKQVLYDSKRTSPRSTRPLPSSRRRRRTPSSLERRALNERLPRNEESLLPRCSITIHQLPSAGRVSKCAAALAPSSPASPDFEHRGRSGRLSQVMSVFFCCCRVPRSSFLL